MNECYECPQPQILDYIKRALAEEDSCAPTESADTIRVAAGGEGGGLYTRGSFMESGIEKMDVFLYKKVSTSSSSSSSSIFMFSCGVRETREWDEEV